MTSIIGALRASRKVLSLGAAVLFATLATQASAQTTFSNATPITIPGTGTSGVGSPYPSDIVVSGMSGAVVNVTVTLYNLSHTWPSDVDMLLVSPSGAKFILCSDTGSGTDWVNDTITLSDSAGALMGTAYNGTGTYRPTNYGANDPFAAPAPAAPYQNAATAGTATFASVFGGTAPNGTWSLYVVDDAGGDIGSMAGGWSITITAAGDPASITTLGSSNNPSMSGQNVTFTSTTTVGGSPVTVGTVEFKEGATTLAGPMAVNGAGQASFSTSSLSNGNHVITAYYSGSAGVAQASSKAITQTVNAPGCNFAPINILDNTMADPYPSTITVSGFSGTLANLKVKLLGFNHTYPDDVDVLLVGPTGQTVVLMQNAGGADDAVGLDLTFDDNAPPMPDATTLFTGSYAPTAYGIATYPAPAPGPAYGTTLAGFNGTSPNGTWSLFVIDDAGIDVGNFSGGWCLVMTPAEEVVSPSSYEVTIGFEFLGDLFSLIQSDDNTLQVLSDDASLQAQIEFNATAATLTPSQLKLRIEHSVARFGLSYSIDQYNFNLNRFDAAVGGVAPTSDFISDITLSATAAAHVSGGGQMRARITWAPINDEDPSSDGWLHYVDQVQWTLSP